MVVCVPPKLKSVTQDIYLLILCEPNRQHCGAPQQQEVSVVDSQFMTFQDGVDMTTT